MYSGRGTCVQFGVADRQEGPAVSVHCEELYGVYGSYNFTEPLRYMIE